MRILVTGGAGYIGSHTVIELLGRGHHVAIVDNFANSSVISIDRIRTISGSHARLYEMDMCDTDNLGRVVETFAPDAVMHFAGLKAVGESITNPLEYYRNNVGGTISLLAAMERGGVRKLIFSSSATVYGNPDSVPTNEKAPVGIGVQNPYGQTKFFGEQIISDVSTADPLFEASILRYFNPIGAHASGLLGEDPLQRPNNLAPYILQVASGKRPHVEVFGNDYSTRDGTGLRDYVHVSDLARGHIAALENSRPGFRSFNLGTGKGTTVLELINAFSRAAGVVVPYVMKERRIGDVAMSIADPTKARIELGWVAERDIFQGAIDGWNWQTKNPNGFGK